MEAKLQVVHSGACVGIEAYLRLDPAAGTAHKGLLAAEGIGVGW